LFVVFFIKCSGEKRILKCGWIHWPATSKVTDRITPDSLREMANPLRPTGNCFSIGLIDGTLRLHASGPRLILPGLESCSLLNESITPGEGTRPTRRRFVGV